MTEKIVLPNGVRLVLEPMEHVRSASVGIWVGSGSRGEKKSENGASHFIEHMLFKGTARRTAADIAMEMDAVGGQLNAFTTKECTVFYAQTLDTHLDAALDVLTDMFFDPAFRERDVETERGVILEEIGMYEDTPEDLVAERLFDRVFVGTPLGRRILGTRSTLGRMTGEFLRDYKDRHFDPKRTVVALAGSFTEAHVAYLKDRFSAMGSVQRGREKPAFYTPGFTAKRKATEQNHIVLAFPAIPQGDERRYALQLLSGVLGRGMSSRLWRILREDRGLCYSIYTFGSAHEDTGVFAVYAAVNESLEREALDLIRREVERFADEGVTEEKLSRAREQVKANVLMGMESTSARMNVLGRSELFFREIPAAEDYIAAYDAVTREQVDTLAREMLDFRQASVSAVGRVGRAEDYEAWARA